MFLSAFLVLVSSHVQHTSLSQDPSHPSKDVHGTHGACLPANLLAAAHQEQRRDAPYAQSGTQCLILFRVNLGKSNFGFWCPLTEVRRDMTVLSATVARRVGEGMA